ncbi:MAG: lipid A deacylase LpxR family protein [Bacteroidota bacterium]
MVRNNSYTNGTRLDLFYTKTKRSRCIIDRLVPKAGDSSINIFGWSLAQLMVTPNDISITQYQPDDYPYAGALFITRSFYSYNAVKKYSFQTELVAGIRGPASFAKELQTFIHSVIHYQKPKGWKNQLNTYPLLNINFTAEKQLLAIGNFIEVIGGAQAEAGTFTDALSFYPLIRIGKMAPYFNGYFSQYGYYNNKGKKIKTQYYLVVKPESTFVLHNALVHGERMNEDGLDDDTTPKDTQRRIRHRLTNIQFGAVVAHGNFSISYLQNPFYRI